MNQRNQSPIIHLAWRVPQVDITHQASSAKLSATVSLHTEFYWILVCVCLCIHCDICWLCQGFVLWTSYYKYLLLHLMCLCASTCVYSGVVLLCLCAGEQCAASMEAVSDDALFRDKLKHMGKCKSDLQYFWPFTNNCVTLLSSLSRIFNDLKCFLSFSNKKEAVWNCQNFLRKDKEEKVKKADASEAPFVSFV